VSWELEALLLVLLVMTAVGAVLVRSMVATVAVLAAFSLFVALLFATMGAPDVAFVEAVLGSAFVSILMLVAVRSTGDRPAGRDRRAAALGIPLVLVLGGALLYGTNDLPARGDTDAPAQSGASSAYLERSLDDTETPNVVTAVLADYRSLDTLGETLVVFTAAVAAAVILFRRSST
jgi:multicomponent Na+:H+ antiporter subunit B